MTVICISGHARSGKDTFAKYLRRLMYENGETKVLIAHYADLVKYVCKQFFGWDGKKDEAGRSLLQKVGTDIVRAKDPTYWIRFIVDMLELFDGTWNYVIIPDCRFPNEIEYLRGLGYNVIHIRIERDDFDNELTDKQKSHPSEIALDGTEPDFLIRNNGSLLQLIKAAITFLEENLPYEN